MERNLRSLRDASQAEASKRQNNKCRSNRSKNDEISEIDALEVDGQIVKRAQEGNAANKIHNDLAERISDRLVGFSESDQQEGAKRGYFPGGE